ncbi:unnamed protein product, partial [Sphacelaria rigidula]
LLNTVKDPVARHILVDSRSPSTAWRALDEQFSPKTSGAKMDVLDEFNILKYTKGQDTDEFWIQLQSVHSRSVTLGLEIPREMIVDKFLNSLPAEYTTIRDQLRLEPSLLTDKTRAVVKDKFLSLKKTGTSRGSDHNRALFAGNKGSGYRSKKKGGGKSQKSAAGSSDGNTQSDKTVEKRNLPCYECGKPGHFKSECPER